MLNNVLVEISVIQKKHYVFLFSGKGVKFSFLKIPQIMHNENINTFDRKSFETVVSSKAAAIFYT